jgi:hypothetical protein
LLFFVPFSLLLLSGYMVLDGMNVLNGLLSTSALSSRLVLDTVHHTLQSLRSPGVPDYGHIYMRAACCCCCCRVQTGFWEMDYAYMKAIEGPIVDGVGLGYPGFFALPGQVRCCAVDAAVLWLVTKVAAAMWLLLVCGRCFSVAAAFLWLQIPLAAALLWPLIYVATAFVCYPGFFALPGQVRCCAVASALRWLVLVWLLM